MTTATLAAPLTARALLFTEQEHGGGDRLGHRLDDLGLARSSLDPFHHLSSSALQAVAKEIGTMAAGLLEMDLGDALLSGWRKYAALTESARRTLAKPGSEEVVVLASHKITSTQRPSVDLLIDGMKVHSFDFELVVAFEITGLAAVVRGGDLIELQGGQCVATATLTLDGEQLAHGQRTLDPGGVVLLGHPVQLVGHPDPER